MSATVVRALVESRPACLTWSTPTRPRPPGDQPALELTEAAPPQPAPEDALAVVVRARWCAKVRPDLPDVRRWSAALTLALVETLHALRPVQQLTRWLDDDVMDAVALHVRRRRGAAPAPGGRPPAIRSIRIQHPDAEVAEVSVHLGTARRSAALAFRLEASGERWLCTALELGPRPAPGC